jgi:hypothetical protein
LTGNESLLQQAAQRLAGLAHDGIQVAAPAIVSGQDPIMFVTPAGQTNAKQAGVSRIR